MEPVGPLLRSLEFKVGALFELMDMQVEHQPNLPKDETHRASVVQEVIGRKRESVLDTLDAVKELLWWQQKRQRRLQRRPRDQVAPAIEAPRAVLPDANQPAGPAAGLADLEELAELKSQLMRRVDEVMAGIDHEQEPAVPQPAHTSPSKGSAVPRNIVRAAGGSPNGHEQSQSFAHQADISGSPARAVESPLVSKELQPTDQIRSQERHGQLVAYPGQQGGQQAPHNQVAAHQVSSARPWPSLSHPAVAALEAEVDNDAPLTGWRYVHEESTLPVSAPPPGKARNAKPLIMTETVFHYGR
jgi:hypothetical protein